MQSPDCCLMLSCVTFFPLAVLQEQSGHVRQPIAIWPGNTKSQMKQREGSCKSHITKSLVKAQEHCSAMTSSPRSLPSKPARAGSSHSHFLSEPPRGWRHNWGVKENHIFSCLDIFFLPRTCESIVIALTTVSPSWWKEITNGTGITFVWMWTLTMIKLLSWKHWWWVCWCQGWFGWKS